MKLSVAALGAVSIFSCLASAASNFSGSCRKEWYIEEGTSIMHASCRSKGGSYRNTRLDLNHCLGNNHGTLVAGNNGNFGWSCDDCLPTQSTSRISQSDLEDLPSNIVIPGLWIYSDLMTCNCDRGDDNGYRLGTPFNLDKVVGNDDGYLACGMDGAWYRGTQE